MREEKTKYYVIKEKAVPEVLLKVIEAKRLMDMQELTVQQATEKAGISRSSFYKYKDDILPFHDNPLPLYSFQEIHLFSQERSYHIPTQYARNFFESVFRSQCFRRRDCFRSTKCERCFRRHLRRQKRLRRGFHHPSGFCASIHDGRSAHPCGL